MLAVGLAAVSLLLPKRGTELPRGQLSPAAEGPGVAPTNGSSHLTGVTRSEAQLERCDVSMLLVNGVFCTKLGGDRRMLAGKADVTCMADGLPAVGGRADGWRIPRSTRLLRFSCPGYRVAEVSLHTMASDVVSLGNIELEPDAELLVRIFCGDDARSRGRATIRCLADAPEVVPLCIESVDIVDGAAHVLFPVPSGEPIKIAAEIALTGTGRMVSAARAAALLISGERSTVDIYATPAVRLDMQVVGPSQAILRSLQVAVRSLDREVEYSQSKLTNEHGRAVFEMPAGHYCTGLMADGVWVPMRRSADRELRMTIDSDSTVECEPVDSIIGVQVVEAGQVVPAIVSVTGPVQGFEASELSACHVFTESAYAQADLVWLMTEDRRQSYVPRSALLAVDDMVTVERAATLESSSLTVQVDQGLTHQHGVPAVVAEPIAGGTPVRIGGRMPPFIGQLIPGEYRVMWMWGECQGPVIHPNIRLRPGSRVELTATPPSAASWTGRVAGLDGLRIDGIRLLQIRVGGVWSSRPPSGGDANFLLLSPPEVGEPVTIRCWLERLDIPARVASVDSSSKSVDIKYDAENVCIVAIKAEALEGGPLRIEVESSIGVTSRPARLGAEMRLPVLKGQPRRGCVIEQIEGNEQVVSWFAIEASKREELVSIKPAGVWRNFTIERRGLDVAILVSGDCQALGPVRVARVLDPASLRIFVADGTTQVHADIGTSQRISWNPDEHMVIR